MRCNEGNDPSRSRDIGFQRKQAVNRANDLLKQHPAVKTLPPTSRYRLKTRSTASDTGIGKGADDEANSTTTGGPPGVRINALPAEFSPRGDPVVVSTNPSDNMVDTGAFDKSVAMHTSVLEYRDAAEALQAGATSGEEPVKLFLKPRSFTYYVGDVALSVPQANPICRYSLQVCSRTRW